MITNEIFYGIKCNRCNELYDDGEHSFWMDESSAIENAMDSEWVEEKGKHYCPDCHDYDEDHEAYTIRPDFPDYLKTLNKFLDNVCRAGERKVIETTESVNVKFRLWNRIAITAFEEQYIKSLLADKFIKIRTEETGARFKTIWHIIEIKL